MKRCLTLCVCVCGHVEQVGVRKRARLSSGASSSSFFGVDAAVTTTGLSRSDSVPAGSFAHSLMFATAATHQPTSSSTTTTTTARSATAPLSFLNGVGIQAAPPAPASSSAAGGGGGGGGGQSLFRLVTQGSGVSSRGTGGGQQRPEDADANDEEAAAAALPAHFVPLERSTSRPVHERQLSKLFQ